jgi:hypothetical protein
MRVERTDPPPEVYLATLGHGSARRYEITLAIGGELVHIAPDTAHELAARLILLANLVDPEGLT